MAFLKYFLPYTVGVLAIIYIQSDFARAADTCFSCNSTNASSSCSVDELDNTTQGSFTKCNTTNGGLCGGISYTYNGTTYVSRLCDANCSSTVLSWDNITNVVCQTCNDSLCNTFEISGASSSIGISIVSLLSAVVALYSL